MIEKSQLVRAVYVYEAPLRLWHWVNALAIVVLCITGYFIGSPLPSMPGEASDHYVMGYMRFFHFGAGYIMAIGLLGRIYWAFVGNSHARQLFILPVTDPQWWKEIWFEARWYLFLEKSPKKYVGHNPLAQLSMFVVFLLGTVFMVFSGFALYAEGLGAGSWADQLFGWMFVVFGSSQALHTWHHMGMWLIIVFIILHTYAAVREDIVSRQSLISTMISGWRMFKDDRP